MTDTLGPGKEPEPETSLALAKMFSPIDHPELLWSPTFQELAPELDHLAFLYWIVAVLRPQHSVTLNIGTGVAHFAVCQTAAEYLTDGQCLGVAAPETELSDAFKQHSDLVYPDISKISAKPVSNGITDAHEIDLIVVEAGLTQGLVADLIEGWVPVLSDKGVVLLFGVGETDPDFDPTLDQLASMAHRSFNIPHGPGLLILVFGTSPPPEILKLTSLTRQDPLRERVTWLFERLGRALNMALKTRAEPISETTGLLASHAEKLSAILSFAEEEARYTDEATVTRTDHLEIDKADRLLNKARARIKNRDIKIAMLSTKLDQLRDEMQLLQAENMSLNKALLQRERDIAETNAAQLAERRQISDLHTELELHKEAQINILSSTSWRITGPLRYIGAWLKRRR